MGDFFCLFISGCEGRAYLTYVMTTNRHIYPSSTHSRHSFIILAFSYTFTVLIFSGGFSPSLHEKDVEAFIRTSVEAKFPSHAYVQHQVFFLLTTFFFPSSHSGELTRVAADCYFARFVGEESYSKGQSKKYLIPDVGPSWCIDPCKLRTDQNETYWSFITLNDMARYTCLPENVLL